MRIAVVEPVELENLTDADARLDGFDTADALREEIRQLYPNRSHAQYQAYRVGFELLPPGEQKKLADEAKRRKAQA